MHMDGGVNGDHLGDPANDTGDFNDQRTGNLRIDYVLPSKSLTVKDCACLLAKARTSPVARPVRASDHRLVWVDILISP